MRITSTDDLAHAGSDHARPRGLATDPPQLTMSDRLAGARRRAVVCWAGASVSSDRCQPGSALVDWHLVDRKLRRTDVVDVPTLRKDGPQVVRTEALWTGPGLVVAVPEHEGRAARREHVGQARDKRRALLL